MLHVAVVFRLHGCMSTSLYGIHGSLISTLEICPVGLQHLYSAFVFTANFKGSKGFVSAGIGTHSPTLFQYNYSRLHVCKLPAHFPSLAWVKGCNINGQF